MYSQHDIEQFAHLLCLKLFDKVYHETEKSNAGDLCIDDKISSDIEHNQLLIDYGNRNQYESYIGFLGGKSYLGYMEDTMYTDDQALFYESINAIYDINALFSIGLSMIQVITDDIILPQEVFDGVFSYKVESEAITPEQQQYIESLEWDSEYWDSLPIEVVDSLAPEVRELCFEYYDILVAEPVRDDVKLDEVESPVPVEVITPQEVVEEPQEDCLSTTEDLNMNNSTIIPSWEVSGYVNLVDLDFSTATTIAYTPEVIPDFWEQDVETEPVVINQVKPVVQLCLPMGKEVVEVEQQQPKLTPSELDDVRASVQRACSKMERRTCYGSPVRHGSPTITTKSGKVVPVSPHAVTPHGDAPKANCINNPKVASAIGEASAVAPTQPIQLNVFQAPEYSIQVVNCKDELLNAESFEEVIATTRKYNATDKQITLDAKASMTKRELAYIEGLKKAYRIIKDSETVKSPQVATPKVATPVVTHNQMMSTIRRMNGGRIPNVVALNKLVTAYIARNNAIISSVSKYIAPELLEIVDKAYSQLTA